MAIAMNEVRKLVDSCVEGNQRWGTVGARIRSGPSSGGGRVIGFFACAKVAVDVPRSTIEETIIGVRITAFPRCNPVPLLKTESTA